MAVQVVKNAKLYVGAYDLSGDTNRLALSQEIEMLDSTTFATNGTRTYIPGLKGVGGNHAGFWNGGDTAVDGVLFGNIGQTDILHTIATTDGEEGDRSYSFETSQSRFTPGGTVGEIFQFEYEFAASGDDLYRGTILKSGNDAETATTNGGALQLGAVLTGGLVVSSIHCVEFTGTSLDVVIASDDGAGFASGTTRITHTQLTDVGSEILSASGPITDDYWRAECTFVGTSFTLVVSVAIV